MNIKVIRCPPDSTSQGDKPVPLIVTPLKNNLIFLETKHNSITCNPRLMCIFTVVFNQPYQNTYKTATFPLYGFSAMHFSSLIHCLKSLCFLSILFPVVIFTSVYCVESLWQEYKVNRQLVLSEILFFFGSLSSYF